MTHLSHKEISKYDHVYLNHPEYGQVDADTPRFVVGLNYLKSIRGVKTILDAGVGRGGFYKLIKNEYDAYGIEPSTVAMEKFLKDDNRIRNICIQDMPGQFSKEVFDVVICLDVLEHIPPEDIDLALSSLAWCAKKYLIFSIANHKSIWDGKHLHVSIFSFEEWEERLKKYFHVLNQIPICYNNAVVYLLEKRNCKDSNLVFDRDRFEKWEAERLMLSKKYTPWIPTPKKSVLRDSAYKAKRAQLFYCRFGIRKMENTDGVYHLYLVYTDSGKKWESTKIALQTEEFKEFLVVNPDTKEYLLVTPKDIHEFLKQDYDFTKAYLTFCQGRTRVDSRPAVAFCVLDSSIMGGGAASVFRYVNWLSDLGVDVGVYSDDKPPDWAGVNVRFHYIPNRQERYRAITEPVVIIYSIGELSDLLSFGKPNGKVIYHLCQGIEEYHYGGSDYSTLIASKPMFDFLFSLPVGRLAVSPHIEDYFKKNYNQKTHNIFNGIDINFFRPQPKKPLGETINILSSGNPLHAFKGKGDIRKALDIIAKKHADLRFSFTIACGEKLDPECISWVGSNYKLILKLGLSPEQMRQAYYDSDIYINSSWHEGFGLPTLEAMACGVPVIQADNQGLTGIVVDRKNCLLFPPSDPDKMAQAIVTLVENEALRNNLIRNGLETAKTFTRLSQYEMFVEEFEKILNCKFDRTLVEAEKQRLQSGLNRSYSRPAHGQIQPQNPESIDLVDRNVEISDVTTHTTQSQESGPPFFSVLIPAYNQAEYLPGALDSLINQTHSDWEAIVVNDGSSDETPDVMARYAEKDKRIRTFHKENGGVASALNHGLQKARGRWICWLSSDDFFEPDKLRIHLQAIEENPEIRFFHTHYFALIEEKGLKVPLELDLNTFIPPMELQVLKFFEINYFNGISIVIHREVFERVGRFNEQYPNAQDFDMWLRISARCRSLFINRRTCVTRLHAKQDSNRFPLAGKLDSARSCLDFLNRHTFAEIFPALDLSRPEHAWFAIKSTLKLLANPIAFINLCGYGPALMDRLHEWLTQSAPADLKSQIEPELPRIADSVRSTNLSEEIKAAFQSISVSGQECFRYRPYEPLMELARHVTRLERKGRAEDASILRHYIDRISPRIADSANVVSQLVLTE